MVEVERAESNPKKVEENVNKESNPKANGDKTAQAIEAVEKVNLALNSTAKKLNEQLRSRLGETHHMLFFSLLIMAGVAVMENAKLAAIPIILIGIRFIPAVLSKAKKDKE